MANALDRVMPSCGRRSLAALPGALPRLFHPDPLQVLRRHARPLRENVRAAGGRWNSEKKVWLVAGADVRRLQLGNRVVTWLEPQ
jgi:hypothetical protein